ncbi:MAG: SdrD B-like domain-containing protein, partial [Anaerolineae bacterium]|nr:SdrD B-like domain-containing protein [Anaerolineae bacterium]
TIREAAGSIGDYVWNDINGNGIQDEAPSLGLRDVILRLYRDDGDSIYEPGAGDALVGTATTTANGSYLFDNLPPGNYWVDVDESTVVGFTLMPGPQSGPEPRFVVLGPNQAFLDADFGYAGRGTISGVVFFDWDENGVQGLGEPGIPNAQVCLYADSDNDGAVDPGSSPLQCLLTGGDGSYQFSGYFPGNYLVVQSPIPGLDNTTPLIRDVTLIVIGSTGSAPNNNFGNVAFGSIGDFIFLDSNGNGVQNPGETVGIANVLVTVTNLDTGQVFTTTSGVSGFYLVDRLIPGNYRVDVPANLPGLVRTTPSPHFVTLALNQDYLLADFGYIAPTAVTLTSFTGSRQANGILLRWVTAAEVDQEGFRVWRATSAQGPYAPVSGVIPAANNPNGASYEWLDAQVKAGLTYWYRLESLPDGQLFGPVSVSQEEGLKQLFIPLVRQRR